MTRRQSALVGTDGGVAYFFFGRLVVSARLIIGLQYFGCTSRRTVQNGNEDNVIWIQNLTINF